MTRPRSLNQTKRQVGGFVLVGFTCLVLAAQATAATPRTLVATLTRVADGDTVIAVTDNGRTLRSGSSGLTLPKSRMTRSPASPTPMTPATTSTT